MENGLGILVIVGFVVVYFLWKKATNAAGKKFTQSVLQPKAHKSGQLITSQVTTYEVETSKDSVYQAIKNGIVAAPEQPKMPAKLYLDQATGSTLAYAYGRMGYRVGFTYVIACRPNGDDATTVICEFSKWARVSGIVHHQKEMKQLVAGVESILRRLDPNLSVSVSNGN